MKIVFVCKRHYTGKDVIRHRFGRLYEFPTQLARLGHQVTVLCLDYRNDDRHDDFIEQFGSGSVRWVIATVHKVLGFEIGVIYRSIKAVQPDVVVGSSDIPSLWLARRLSRLLGVAYAVDLYDNYESFGQARIPGFRHVLKASIRDAGTIIVVSSALREKITNDYAPHGAVVVMTNGISRSSFFPGDRATARAALGLPLNSRLIGTAGNLSRMKGLDTVYNAWTRLEGFTENIYLVIAGRVDPEFPVPSGARVIYLGELLEAQVSHLFRALDVGIIPAHDSEFGRYCFPQKLFEMVACGLPVVAAKVGAITQALRASPEVLFAPGDDEGLTAAVILQLENSHLADIKPMEWSELIESVEPVILDLAKQA
ncbi:MULTISPECIES: glycosyltransferase family 4 protein [Stutzerimonas]|uniref:glycosyltransferase family 4 protein n=1 Tax=Stutzerimonas TaxID=2901164 RepID=UPI000F774CEE|nr:MULTISPECIES: glycosyltransferase family 4 protein [Stutzerimonas]MBS9723633.1 glycosyltransferase family 4 protein [Stutzerimonas stutzeri]RRV50002.1 glycosyltransferase [Stutzerimonas stutzeri]RRV56162.1 glycosyltransferase [Stutzerimonas stutzeri]